MALLPPRLGYEAAPKRHFRFRLQVPLRPRQFAEPAAPCLLLLLYRQATPNFQAHLLTLPTLAQTSSKASIGPNNCGHEPRVPSPARGHRSPSPLVLLQGAASSTIVPNQSPTCLNRPLKPRLPRPSLSGLSLMPSRREFSRATFIWTEIHGPTHS
jgi:hypothetical protein